MKKICLVLCLAALLTFSAVRAEAATEEGVYVLTDDNFDDEIARHEYLLVEFYAPWWYVIFYYVLPYLNTCYSGHCKQLAPEYAKAAQRLAQNNPPYYIAKVDATEHKKIAERFAVKGFPTLYFFK